MNLPLVPIQDSSPNTNFPLAPVVRDGKTALQMAALETNGLNVE